MACRGYLIRFGKTSTQLSGSSLSLSLKSTGRQNHRGVLCVIAPPASITANPPIGDYRANVARILRRRMTDQMLRRKKRTQTSEHTPPPARWGKKATQSTRIDALPKSGIIMRTLTNIGDEDCANPGFIRRSGGPKMPKRAASGTGARPSNTAVPNCLATCYRSLTT